MKAGTRAIRPAILATLLSAPLAAEPDLVLLSVDTLRADAVGAYGAGDATTPTIDALAAAGVLFEDAQTTIGKTGPAFASIFTSLYPPTHGSRRNAQRMRSDVPVLAQILGDAGYEAAAFISNWTLRADLVGLDRGFDHYDEEFDQSRNAAGVMERNADGIARAAERWLRRRARDEERNGKPLFLWVHFSDPHSPYLERTGFTPARPPREQRTTGWQKRWRYQSEVNYVDHWMGRLSRTIEEVLPGPRFTLFLSDHGESLGEHGYWGHGKNVHWPNARIPMILAGPGVPKGRRVQARVGVIDVLPTLLDLLGVETPEEVEGRSLAPFRTGGDGGDTPRYVIGDKHSALTAKSRRNAPYEDPLQISLEVNGAKVLHDFSKRRTTYFDLTADPREERPLDKPPVDLVPPLGRRLVNWYRDLEKYEAKSGTVLSEDDIKQLKSLGYID
ncbi:MAG: sulfatase [Acidobacteria bacterium]|nr:sulfatase [Acidobacteriota bacterium]